MGKQRPIKDVNCFGLCMHSSSLQFIIPMHNHADLKTISFSIITINPQSLNPAVVFISKLSYSFNKVSVQVFKRKASSK